MINVSKKTVAMLRVFVEGAFPCCQMIHFLSNVNETDRTRSL